MHSSFSNKEPNPIPSIKHVPIMGRAVNGVKLYYTILDLEHSENWAEYKNTISQIGPSNPFYAPELIYNIQEPSHLLKCFVVFEEERPIMALPYVIRPIQHSLVDDSNYYDVHSPYGYSGPIMMEGLKQNIIQIFWDTWDNWCQQNRIVSVFIRFSLKANYHGFTGKLLPTLQNVAGKLSSLEEIWENFKPKVRNNYRLAEKNELQTLIFKGNISKSIVSTFHKIYLHTMQRNEADQQYFYPETYFQNFVAENPDKCGIAMTYYKDIPISTELMLFDSDTIYSFLGGTMADFFAMRPNDHLKVSVMQWGIPLGFKKYILGGGRQNDDGLYRYKKCFFPKDEDITYFTGRKVILENIYRNLVKNLHLPNPLSDNESIPLDGYFPLYRLK